MEIHHGSRSLDHRSPQRGRGFETIVRVINCACWHTSVSGCKTEAWGPSISPANTSRSSS